MANCKGDTKRPMPIENLQLHIPELEELCDIILGGLKSNYKNASCAVTECPNLADAPYYLAASGMNSPSALHVLL